MPCGAPCVGPPGALQRVRTLLPFSFQVQVQVQVQAQAQALVRRPSINIPDPG